MTGVLQAKITGLAGPAPLEAQGEDPRLPGSPLMATALRALLLSAAAVLQPHLTPPPLVGPL